MEEDKKYENLLEDLKKNDGITEKEGDDEDDENIGEVVREITATDHINKHLLSHFQKAIENGEFELPNMNDNKEDSASWEDEEDQQASDSDEEKPKKKNKKRSKRAHHHH